MRESSIRIAFCGIMTCLGIIFMILGGIIPVLTYAVPLFASLILIPVIDRFGSKTALLVYIATAILSLIIGLDKEASFFYIFFGYYPILKPKFEKFNKYFSLLLKLWYFTVSLSLMYYILLKLFALEALLADFSSIDGFDFVFFITFLIVLIITLMIFDFALTRTRINYLYKIKPKYKILNK